MTLWGTTISFNYSVNTDWFKDKFIYSAVRSMFVNKTLPQIKEIGAFNFLMLIHQTTKDRDVKLAKQCYRVTRKG